MSRQGCALLSPSRRDERGWAAAALTLGQFCATRVASLSQINVLEGRAS